MSFSVHLGSSTEQERGSTMLHLLLPVACQARNSKKTREIYFLFTAQETKGGPYRWVHTVLNKVFVCTPGEDPNQKYFRLMK